MKKNKWGAIYYVAILCANVSSHSNESSERFISEGKIIRNQSGCEKALPYFEKAIVADPKSDLALSWAGVCYRDMERWNDSLEFFHRAVKMRPKSAGYYLGLSMAYGGLGEWPKALETALEKCGSSARLCGGVYASGLFFAKIGSTKKRLKVFKSGRYFTWSSKCLLLLGLRTMDTKTLRERPPVL
ncbi:MAG: tetratricopeptide repeat protein [Elusimicrobia bacterium]|nr:tetratricopeptide repeat protein [Elusimicrobiota bacterium]